MEIQGSSWQDFRGMLNILPRLGLRQESMENRVSQAHLRFQTRPLYQKEMMKYSAWKATSDIEDLKDRGMTRSESHMPSGQPSEATKHQKMTLLKPSPAKMSDEIGVLSLKILKTTLSITVLCNA